MEISFNGNLGIGRETGNIGSLDAGHMANDASKVSDATSLHVSRQMSQMQPADLASAEPVASVPADALLRDDALGKLVKSAFNLPPPPMPAFAD